MLPRLHTSGVDLPEELFAERVLAPATEKP
jgi:hypothetical protein